jgi:PAS domain S-box-containing protein
MRKDRADLGPPPTQRRLSTREMVRAVFYTVTTIVLVVYLTHTLRMEREYLLVGQTQRQLETHTKLIAEGIQAFFTDISQDLGFLARHPTILDKANQSLVTGEPSTATSLCQSFFEAHKRNIDALYILNARGVVVQAVPPMPEEVGIDMGNKPDVAHVLREHRTHISEVFRAPSNNLAISILYPLFANEEFVGAVRCVTHIETICSRFIHSVKIGESGYAWLLDDRGRILGHPRSKYVGRDLVTLNRDILPAHERSGLESIVANMTQGETGVGIYQSAWQSEEDGETKNELIAYAPVRIDHGLWSVAVSMSFSETIGTFNKQARKDTYLGFFVVFLFLTGVILFFRTDRKRIESSTQAMYLKQIADSAEAVREREELFRTVLESTGDGISVTDETGAAIHVNSRFVTMWNLPQEAVDAGDNMKLLECAIAEVEDPAAFTSRMQELFYSLEEALDTLSLRDGRVLERFSSPLIRNGVVSARVWSFRDVTDRKRAEEALREHQEHLEELVEIRSAKLKSEVIERKQAEHKIRKLNQDLEERVKERTADLEKALDELKKLDEIKDSFLSSVSHELRTPLTSIRSFSEILLRYVDEDPGTQKEFIQIINTESERLSRLIDDLLDLARIEAGEMLWRDSILSLQEIIEDVAKAQHQLLAERSLRLRIDISPDLPLVLADRDRIQQVITNLLGNAVKFSFEGGEISLVGEVWDGKGTGEISQWIKVCVSDQGIGIQEGDHEIIFDRFRQVSADSSKDKPKGTGLGLPICKEILSHYGGNIWVVSEKDKGSTFFFTLPVATASDNSAKHIPALDKPVPG